MDFTLGPIPKYVFFNSSNRTILGSCRPLTAHHIQSHLNWFKWMFNNPNQVQNAFVTLRLHCIGCQSTILNIAMCTGTLPPTPPKKCTEYTKNPDLLTLPWITFLEQTGMWPDAFKMLFFEEDHMWRCVEREGQAKTRVPLSPASTWSTQASLSSMLRWYKVLTYRNNIALSILIDILAELTNTNTQYQKPRSK